MSWDENLEGVAKRIAEIDLSPLRVLAGPGTGKTFALTRRVARLLEGGAEPSRMLVCTFTRTIAADLKKEIAALGLEDIDAVRAGTLHGFCFSLLSRGEVLALTGRKPRPLLKSEQRFLLEDLKNARFGGIRGCSRRLEAFNSAWARLQNDEPGWPSDPVDRAFQAELKSWLLFHQAILVGEVVPETLTYLRENPASEDRSAFDHVLVDEYQDLNRAEQVLLDLLAEDGTLTVIGDENQSIYSFKFAHPEGISRFHENHPGTHDETLDECRRCPALVIELANHLISRNDTSVPRPLQPMSTSSPGEVVVVQWPSMGDEARGLARFIHKRIESGTVSPGQVLVLAARRQFGYGIRDELKSLGTPALSFFYEEDLEGDPKDESASSAQAAYFLLSLLVDREDRVALRAWCGFGSPSLRSGAWKRVRSVSESTGATPWTVLQEVADGSRKLAGISDLVGRFRQVRDRLSELDALRGRELVDALFPLSEPWAEPLRTLAETLSDNDCDAPELLDGIRSGIVRPELPVDVDYVRVMSLHKSKGLTANLVLVAGCVQGLIPHLLEEGLRAEQLAHLEEQRRLFYVAITRTRCTLVLSSVTSLPRQLAYKMRAKVLGGSRNIVRAIASEFLAELGPRRPIPILGAAFLEKTGAADDR